MSVLEEWPSSPLRRPICRSWIVGRGSQPLATTHDLTTRSLSLRRRERAGAGRPGDRVAVHLAGVLLAASREGDLIAAQLAVGDRRRAEGAREHLEVLLQRQRALRH